MSRIDRERGMAWVGEPVEHRNRLGHSVYQPALVTGERMWLEPGWEGPYSVWVNKAKLEEAADERRATKAYKKTPPRPASHLTPFLTSYKRAVRLARAESKAKYRGKYINDYKEVL